MAATTREVGRVWGGSWPPRIIAERGASSAPENSLRAFRDAVAAGADAIELDIMRCGTGEVVVCHDRALAVLATKQWDSVAAAPLAALRGIDLGGGERIALLAEALATIPADTSMIVRLSAAIRDRSDHAELAMIVTAIAKRERAIDRMLVSSEAGEVLAPFVDAGVATALIVPSNPIRARREPQRLPDVVQLELHNASTAAVRRWHARGVAVHISATNTTSQLIVACSLGVDGVMSRDPAGARQAIDQLARSRPDPRAWETRTP